jgi:hypothetical protein
MLILRMDDGKICLHMSTYFKKSYPAVIGRLPVLIDDWH